ncbi:unnamed protein product [Sphagnum troendelagicum]|uniref:Uncharacterized protein n=1 Tax=Sphagnum troendelagicum TaxID=128251 RepID=A0ABP0TVL9_9BRYO
MAIQCAAVVDRARTETRRERETQRERERESCSNVFGVRCGYNGVRRVRVNALSGDHNAQEFLEEVCLDCRVRSHHIFLDGCGCAQVERGDNCWLEGG